MNEQELREYTKWLMEVWNPNQLYIPFAVDAPKAYLRHKAEQLNLLNVTNNVVTVCSNCKKGGVLFNAKYCLNCGSIEQTDLQRIADWRLVFGLPNGSITTMLIAKN